jgi:thiamine-monophosphate kinase
LTHPCTPEFDRIARAFGWSTDPGRVGDDAALLPGGRLLCCDALAEGVHFRWDWSGPEDVGWKAVAANVADILAMGGLPDTAVWSIGMGADWGDEVFAGLARGALDACAAYGCALVGGDTVRCSAPGFLSLSLLGTLRARIPWKRSGARTGDRLVLAGTLGRSAAGLAALQAGASAEWTDLVTSHRRPEPPFVLATSLFDLDIHAAIDLSDGLSSESAHLASASGTAVVLDASALAPSADQISLASRLGLDPMDWLLHGGEDHSLLLAVSPEVVLPGGILEIGRVEEGDGIWLQTGAGREALLPKGWRHD